MPSEKNRRRRRGHESGVPPPSSTPVPPPPLPPSFRLNDNRERPSVLGPSAEITPLDKLVIRPGDTLVVRTANGDGSECDKIRRVVRRQLPESVGVVVVRGDELAVIRPDTLRPADNDQDEHPDTGPGYCCCCGSKHVVYHNYVEQPFCGPCANGDCPDRCALVVDETPDEKAAAAEQVDWHEIAGNLAEALRLTREYVGDALPALAGWSWFDAIEKYLSAGGKTASEPRRNVAIRIAREYDQACANEYELAESERMKWDERPILYRARLANVFENLLARGVIKP